MAVLWEMVAVVGGFIEAMEGSDGSYQNRGWNLGLKRKSAEIARVPDARMKKKEGNLQLC